MEDITIKNNIVVPSTKLKFKYSRSGGKGGQNVNKVSTKVEVVVNVNDIVCSVEKLGKIKKRLSSKLDGDENIHVTAQESRSQWQNKQSAINKLIDLIEDASQLEKKRRKTKPTYSSKLNRKSAKKIISVQKKLRSRVSPHDL